MKGQYKKLPNSQGTKPIAAPVTQGKGELKVSGARGSSFSFEVESCEEDKNGIRAPYEFKVAESMSRANARIAAQQLQAKTQPPTQVNTARPSPVQTPIQSPRRTPTRQREEAEPTILVPSPMAPWPRPRGGNSLWTPQGSLSARVTPENEVPQATEVVVTLRSVQRIV